MIQRLTSITHLVAYGTSRDIDHTKERWLTSACSVARGTYIVAWVLCQLEIRQQVLDLHALKEFVSAYDPIWDAVFLQC